MWNEHRADVLFLSGGKKTGQKLFCSLGLLIMIVGHNHARADCLEKEKNCLCTGLDIFSTVYKYVHIVALIWRLVFFLLFLMGLLDLYILDISSANDILAFFAIIIQGTDNQL